MVHPWRPVYRGMAGSSLEAGVGVSWAHTHPPLHPVPGRWYWRRGTSTPAMLNGLRTEVGCKASMRKWGLRWGHGYLLPIWHTKEEEGPTTSRELAPFEKKCSQVNRRMHVNTACGHTEVGLWTLYKNTPVLSLVSELTADGRHQSVTDNGE